jgi:acetamidase/formamidase
MQLVRFPFLAVLWLSLIWTALDPGRCAAVPANPIAGDWLMNLDVAGTPVNKVLTLKVDGGKVSGTLRGLGQSAISGTLDKGALRFTVQEDGKTYGEYEGALRGDQLSGTARVFHDQPEQRLPARWTARRLPPPASGPPRRHELVPTRFYRSFSPLNPPVLHVRSGDTVHTTTVDAGGTDEKGVHRVVGGNPQTGPFYVDDALPGDTLKVTLTRLRLNRDWAISDDGLVPRALSARLGERMKYEPRDIRWRLDRQRGLAMPDPPDPHLARYAVPVKPMLGCVATAPPPINAAPPTGDSGSYGGNMDYNEVGEGAVVYLPVFEPGALLYVGDGHAVQGDGELNGNALETSMEVEFSVQVIHDHEIPGPRVETADYIQAMALAGSLDDAFRQATGHLTTWLLDEYKLTPSEAAQVMGTAVEYRISEVADRNAGVVARLRKSLLANLTH